MEIPSINIPSVENIETISIPLPTADVPSYVPLVVPPSDLQAEEEIEGEASEETEQPGMRMLGMFSMILSPHLSKLHYIQH